MEKLGLVLSGGAAYGLAHIGVLKQLEKNKVKVDVITGTSMGALIGGLYCAGVSVKKMEEILAEFKLRKVVDINFFPFHNSGFVKGKKIEKFIEKYVGNKNIEDCKVKFCCIATDLNTGKKVVIDKGSLAAAIRASISVPGLLNPVKKDDMLLIDGGSSDNMPVEDAKKLGAKKIISVDVSSYYKKQEKMRSVIDIVLSASNIFVANLLKAKKDLGDVYIRIDQPNVKMDKFFKENSFNSIKNGEEAAQKYMPQILELLKVDSTTKKHKN